MVEDPLELGGGLRGLMRCKVRLAANVDGVQGTEASDEARAAERKVVARGDLQRLTRRSRGLVLRDSSGAPKFFTFTGEFQGTLPHFGNGDKLP